MFNSKIILQDIHNNYYTYGENAKFNDKPTLRKQEYQFMLT